MALTYKVVNGVAPNAATETTLYTCPAATKAVVTQFGYCRLSGAGAGVVTVWICDGGGATSPARAVLVQLSPAFANSEFIGSYGPNAIASTTSPNAHIFPVRWHLAATDTLVVNFTVAPNGSISFRPTILEIT